MCIVQTHRYKSASIKIHPVGQSGAIQVDYFGAFTEDAIEALTGKALEEVAKGRVMLVRLDRAVLAFKSMPEAARSRFMNRKIPGAVVCSPEQYEAVRAICSDLSSSGSLRLVFLDYSQALAWADGLASDLRKQEAKRMRRDAHELESLDRLLVGCHISEPANEQTAKTLRQHR